MFISFNPLLAVGTLASLAILAAGSPTNLENIYLAASNGNDASSFTELHNGHQVLKSRDGDGGVRDPFIMRSPKGNKFYILATDPCTACGTPWGEPRSFGISPDNYGNTWASEAYYDEELQTYVVYWASSIYNSTDNPKHNPLQYQRMVYATTQDFQTFSEPKIWQDEPSRVRIDSTVIKQNNTYYRFTKATIDGCADIVQEKSSNLTAGLAGRDKVASCIDTNAGTKEVEVPSIFKTNCQDVNGPRYIMLTEEFGGNGYVPLESSNLASGRWTLRKGFK